MYENPVSTNPRNIAMITTKTITTDVICRVSLLVGHTTFLASVTALFINPKVSSPWGVFEKTPIAKPPNTNKTNSLTTVGWVDRK